MSEGELKKRIDELYGTKDAESGDWLTSADVFEILDEAAKERPKLTYSYQEPGHVPYLDFQKLANEDSKWFKKWFGES